MNHPFHLRRRDLLAGLAVSMLPAAAQAQKAPRRIGYLTLAAGPTRKQSDFFEQGLRELGYRPGEDVVIDYRWGAGQLPQLPALARELVALKPDAIVVATTPVVKAVRDATATVPIVIVHAADPVQTGLVASLSRPGGNITGFSTIAIEIAPKRIELLREMLPNIRRVAFLAHRADPAHTLFLDQTQQAVDRFGLQLQRVIVNGPDEFERAFAEMARERADVVVVQPIFLQEREQTRRIIALALQHRLPSVSDFVEEFATPGGLIAYGTSRSDLYRRAAGVVDRIFRGTPPGEIPIEQPVKFEIGINLTTAKTLGIEVPQTLLARADELID